MKIEFIHYDQSAYTASALRADGVTVSIPGYDRTSLLPHDIVEKQLELKRGFWGQVAVDALFPDMKILGRCAQHC